MEIIRVNLINYNNIVGPNKFVYFPNKPEIGSRNNVDALILKKDVLYVQIGKEQHLVSELNNPFLISDCFAIANYYVNEPIYKKGRRFSRSYDGRKRHKKVSKET